MKSYTHPLTLFTLWSCCACYCRGCERSDITKHVLIHDQPRHACDICGKSFRHIKNKELHLKRSARWCFLLLENCPSIIL